MAYCSECGAEASGNFCSTCGKSLHAAAAGWADSVVYSEIIQHGEVREAIARHAALARKRMSGEDFLAHCDKALKPMVGIGLAPLAEILVPIYSALGMKTGKSRQARIQRPPGATLLSLLCSLARNGQQIVAVSQGSDGCVVEARLPSDLWSFDGKLIASLKSAPNETTVEVATVIKGQLYDWGRSKRVLQTLLADLDREPAMH